MTQRPHDDKTANGGLVIVDGVFTEFKDANSAIEAEPSIVIAELGLLEPAETDSLTLTFDEPGVYQYFCTLTGHFAAEMRGTFTVKG
ncbi:MAG: plastocyanin/azurin family copper-binding protein [Acidimicrobiia bacterium]